MEDREGKWANGVGSRKGRKAIMEELADAGDSMDRESRRDDEGEKEAE